jgi:hypothetical protein
MLKWKLLLSTLPIVALVVAVALIRDYVLHLKGIIEFSDVTPLLSGVALIVGLMLAGVLTDFKESEKIPGELATTLETIGDTVQVVKAVSKEYDAAALEGKYHALVAAVEDWFLRRIKIDRCYAALEEFRAEVKAMHAAAGAPYAIRCLGETHNLRRTITRVDVISRTSFIPAGYALLDLLVTTTVILLLIANYKSVIAEYFLITIFSLIYIYLVRLIRDVDDPFEYEPGQAAGGAVEVDPYPLVEFRQRSEAKREAEG